METLAILWLCTIIAILFWRQVLQLLTLGFRLVVIWLAIRLLFLWNDYQLPQVDMTSFLPAVIIGGVLGFFIVGILCVGYIRHMLIRFYLSEAIAKQKAAAQAGRLW